ncbi:MsnO8 family LLM class oxidoreductase [Streptomyces hainanensis]|uniref:MsnO8 family LLM class oxidoreductase n=1 Tax=Streptomyces hainanensis TaxID=402648 RepID=A0A4R4SZJ2_9ACTN|nr:MsnO8 family LLM class oxidoreductase [Streptomyces hainanensis]
MAITSLTCGYRSACRGSQGVGATWVAEHHAVPGVAGSAPTVLAAAVAAATRRIRVGTGGVMLPNHRPLVVAEQFGVLEALFPGRIDMGLGRSVGFTADVRRALGADKADADRFGERLTELLAYFDGTAPLAAPPATGLRVPAFVLAVGEGAAIAAALGLPLVMAHLSDEDRMLAAIDRYRAEFTPGPHGDRPQLLLAVNAAVAATAEEAAKLQVPEAWATVYSRTRGVFPPLEAPHRVAARQLTEREQRLFDQARAGQLHGDEREMTEKLGRLIARTDADELLLTFGDGLPGRFDSYRRLARLAGLTSTGG